MEPIQPSWFKQRQGKAEKVADDTYQLTAPILPASYISIRRGENGRWAAALSTEAGGSDLAATAAEFDNRGDAWGAAFELYRTHIVV